MAFPKALQGLFIAREDFFVCPGQKAAALKGEAPVRGNKARLKIFYCSKPHAAGAGA